MATTSGRPLRLAVYNVVDFHLHVVAGALQVLRRLSSAPVTAFMTPGVLVGDRFGFSGWLGRTPGVEWRSLEDAERNKGHGFDLVWFLSPEWDIQRTRAAAVALRPRVALYYVHNGHMPAQQLAELAALCGPDVPLLGMGPHVARHLAARLSGELHELLLDGLPTPRHARVAEWLFPTAEWCASSSSSSISCSNSSSANNIGKSVTTDNTDGSSDFNSRDDDGSSVFFCIAGSTDPSLRDYGRLWQLLRDARTRHSSSEGGGGDSAGRVVMRSSSLRLSILGEVTAGFTVPGEGR
jgi:hypothetical protein